LDDKVMVSIPGKHGEIRLIVPNRNPTESELNDLYRVIAEVAIKIEQNKEEQEKEKSAV